MSYLKVTLIDVGWGDSILIEASDKNGSRPRFALIDANDSEHNNYLPSWTFLRKHFGSRENEFDTRKPFFDFIMLSHDHADHGSGLMRVMKKYGTNKFWYSKSRIRRGSVLPDLIAYVNNGRVQISHQAIDNGINIGKLGDIDMDVMWPQPDQIDPNPNNNSIVLSLKVHNTTFLLTGDAEGRVWDQIASDIPDNISFLKVPHHGSENGTIYHRGTPWVDRLDDIQPPTHLGISCHPNFPGRYKFPNTNVLKRFDERPYPCYRTDMHYHITFTADFSGVRVKYSHE